MKRLLLAALVAIMSAAGLAGGAGVQASAPYISNFEIDYHLSRDDEGRSTLEVTERITAEFPVNKNKGLVREIPRKYQGHSVSFALESLTRNGQAEPISDEYNKGDLHVIETGTNDYINGTQVFELKYSMRDVTRYFADTNADEFYWDTNGTGWRSRIENLSVRLTIDETLQQALNGDTACYRGQYGSKDKSCDFVKGDDGFTVAAANLSAEENVTIAIGFEPGTFEKYQPTAWERALAVWIMLLIITSIISVALIIWFIVRAHRWKYRSAELGTIVPEYLPPKDAGIAAAATVLPNARATPAAELTDLAVRRYIEILQSKSKRLFKQTDYSIRVVKDIKTLREEEKEVLIDMYGKEPAIGKRLSLRNLRYSQAAYERFKDNDKKLQTLVRDAYGLYRVDKAKRGWFGGAAKLLLVLGILTLSPPLLLASLVAFIFSKTLWVLTDKGLALRRYLGGLEMYIKVAEQERLKMLQSPEGAEKIDIKDAKDPAQLVKLYEKVLPYAILFGQQKQWTKQLGEYYVQAGVTPEWYRGQAAFNAMMFSSAMSGFSSSVSTTSAASSSSGGSSGGGFSGGGGGGGGGGFR